MNTETGEILSPDKFAEFRQRLMSQGRHNELEKWRPTQQISR